MNSDDRERVLRRFWLKVNKTDGCWLWTAATGPNGYGRMFYMGRLHQAHRVSYEMLVGPIPGGLHLDHLCRVRACVNPAHLEPVTQQENIRRGENGIQHRSKTHCPKGHPYAGSNLAVRQHYSGGRINRVCRECANARNSARRASWSPERLAAEREAARLRSMKNRARSRILGAP